MEPLTDLRALYREHPFRILSASPRDERETLIRLQGDAALLGDSEKSARALAELLHPESRLDAEIRWFPQTDPKTIGELFRWLEKPEAEKRLPRFILPTHLAQFNFVRLILTALPVNTADQMCAVFHSLSSAADALLPGQVLAEINGDRAEAGFALLDDPQAVASRLQELFLETVRSCVSRSRPASFAAVVTVSRRLKKEYTDIASPYHNSLLLRIASKELAQLYR